MTGLIILSLCLSPLRPSVSVFLSACPPPPPIFFLFLVHKTGVFVTGLIILSLCLSPLCLSVSVFLSACPSPPPPPIFFLFLVHMFVCGYQCVFGDGIGGVKSPYYLLTSFVWHQSEYFHFHSSGFLFSVYSVEAMLKIIGRGPRDYFTQGWDL